MPFAKQGLRQLARCLYLLTLKHKSLLKGQNLFMISILFNLEEWCLVLKVAFLCRFWRGQVGTNFAEYVWIVC